MATLATFSNQEIAKNRKHFLCECCDYSTSNKYDYSKHLQTMKHQSNETATENRKKSQQIAAGYECDKCAKPYKDKTGLWRHKKSCAFICVPPPTQESHVISSQITPDIILSVLQQNKELQQLIMEQNKTIVEMSKNSQVNHNVNHTNSHNKTFNLQVFLNETCKDAMNIKDFIQSLELNLTDLEKVGELGYAEGISRMFIKGLNNLEITKRPIHCSDVKREIMHIKHEDKWEKDNANQDKLKNIIKQLTHKNIMMLDDWKKANPGCTEYNSKKYDHYLKLTMESMGPCDDAEEKRDFNKIIRRIAESTAIDKKYLMV
jgi:hypothetical protein